MRDEERRFAAQRAEPDSSLVVEHHSVVDAAVTVPAAASNGGLDDAAVHAILTKVENGLPPNVAELYSPFRTSFGAQQFGLAPGVAIHGFTNLLGLHTAKAQASSSWVRAKDKAALDKWESRVYSIQPVAAS